MSVEEVLLYKLWSSVSLASYSFYLAEPLFCLYRKQIMSLPSRLSQQALLLGEWSHWASFDWEHRSPVYFQQLNVYLASLGRQPTYWHGALPIYNQIAYPGSNLDGTAPPIPYTPVSDESSLSRDLSTVSSKSTSCHSSTSTSSSRRCRFNCGLIVEIHEVLYPSVLILSIVEIQADIDRSYQVSASVEMHGSE